MDGSLTGVIPSLVILGSFLLAAIVQARRHDLADAAPAQRLAAARALLLAAALQSVHFLEEAAMDFHDRFPAAFDLPEIPFPLFTVFNLLWIAAWFVSVFGLRQGNRAALAAAWFLAIAGTANGIAHPALALAEAGYFPGLVTAPLVGLASLNLGFRLARAARPLHAGL